MDAEHRAREQWSLQDAEAHLPEAEAHLAKILRRLGAVGCRTEDADLLDVGAAQGLLLIACARRGLRAAGVEPWAEARSRAEELAKREGVHIRLVDGTAEALPFPAESFDVVHANVVIEHVSAPQAMLNEACRVLRAGGALWFSGASSLCPRQREIRRFPCFGWYPDRLKRRIMEWVKCRRPHLIGYTQTPALNWLTPWKARRMLRQAGFGRVYDRWDLRLPDEGGPAHALALRLVRLTPVGKFVADVLVPTCSYAAVKPPEGHG